MLDAAVKALSQILTPPLRAVLWKSIGLALVVIIVLGVGLQRLLFWLATGGEGWAESALGPSAHGPLSILLWIVSIAAGVGILFGSVFLMPAVTSFVGSFFVDEIADAVERAHYPTDPPGAALPLPRAVVEGLKTALLTMVVYLCALPLLLFAGVGLPVFFLATAYLLGREYFELAAMRFRPPQDAKRLRRHNAGTVFAAGLLIAIFVSIPIVNLATPLFAMALMVHMHKLVSQRRPVLMEARG